jgi:hypothetical protein
VHLHQKQLQLVHLAKLHAVQMKGACHAVMCCHAMCWAMLCCAEVVLVVIFSCGGVACHTIPCHAVLCCAGCWWCIQ